MFIQIDFDSDEALYMQLHDQILVAIAQAVLKEGDQLPSVRMMADEIGINMHTVNKAYALLRDEGFLSLNQRRGAVIEIDIDKLNAIVRLKDEMRILLAGGILKEVSREEVHELVDEIYNEYGI